MGIQLLDFVKFFLRWNIMAYKARHHCHTSTREVSEMGSCSRNRLMKATGHIAAASQRPMRHPIDMSTSKTLWRSKIHILAILITSFLVARNARNAYFYDIDGFTGQDVFLQSLQYVVKFHEILMAASITDIVLYRIR